MHHLKNSHRLMDCYNFILEKYKWELVLIVFVLIILCVYYLILLSLPIMFNIYYWLESIFPRKLFVVLLYSLFIILLSKITKLL